MNNDFYRYYHIEICPYYFSLDCTLVEKYVSFRIKNFVRNGEIVEIDMMLGCLLSNFTMHVKQE